MKKAQSGSVLVYILLAVALFGALTYAMSQGTRTGVSQVSDQQAALIASDIIEYGQTVANAVQKLKLRGCSDTDISLQNSIISGYNNGTNTSCQVFHVDGGNINIRDFTDYSGLVEPVIFTGANQIQNAGDTEGELLLLVGDISLNVCESINDSLTVSNPPANLTATLTKFTGTFANGTTLNTSNALSGCYNSGGSGTYYYYQALLIR